MPPEAVALQLNALPEVMPEVGHATVTVTGWPPTVTVAEFEAVTVFPSCAVALIV